MSDQDFIRRIELVPASSVAAERVEWLIDCWVPRRSLTLLAGREGLGKSTIACDIAARATRGELDNSTVTDVIYLQTEDSRAMTVRPRLEAAGANLDHVHFVDVTMTDVEGQLEASLDLPRDFALLEETIAANDIGLVILDAAKSAMSSKIDGNSDEQVRRFLEPMTRIADRNDCAFLGLVHFGKRASADTGKLILGSAAWSQVARSVLSVARDDDAGVLLVTNTKANLAPRVVTLEATLESVDVPTDNGPASVGRIVWGGESSRDARDLLRGTDDDDEQDSRGEIEAVVLDYLESQGGSAPAGDVLKATRAAGLNDNAVKKARKKFGVSTRKAGMGGGWVWSIEPLTKVPEDSEGSHARERAPSAPSAPSTPVEFPAPEPTPFTAPAGGAVDKAILSSLSTDYPLESRTLTMSIPKKLRAELDLDAHLERLAAAGRITRTPKGYLLTERNAS